MTDHITARPPRIWQLVLRLNNGGDSEAFATADRIVHSYLGRDGEPDKFTLETVDEYTVVYSLDSVDWVIDRSIFKTISDETYPHLKVEVENPTWIETE